MLIFPSEDKTCLSELCLMVRDRRHDELEAMFIDCKVKGDYAVLNYRQGLPKNPHNMLTRGLVIRVADGQVVSMPFKRFGNLGEEMVGNKTEVVFSDCDILEKLDGSLLAVSFPDADVNKPLFHTRRMLSTADMDAVSTAFSGEEEFSLLRNALSYISRLNWRLEHTSCTWVFELIDRERPVITKYTPEQLGVYLIGVRNLEDFSELSEDRLDREAVLLGAGRPRRWPTLGDAEAVRAMLSSFPDDYEGFILRERTTGRRAKVKSDDYLKRHRLLGQMLYKNLIPLWLEGETDEITLYLPETKEKFAEIDRRMGELFNQYLITVEGLLKGHDSRKSLALSMQAAGVPRLTQSLAFACFGNKDATVAIHEKMVTWPVDTLQELMALED